MKILQNLRECFLFWYLREMVRREPPNPMTGFASLRRCMMCLASDVLFLSGWYWRDSLWYALLDLPLNSSLDSFGCGSMPKIVNASMMLDGMNCVIGLMNVGLWASRMGHPSNMNSPFTFRNFHLDKSWLKSVQFLNIPSTLTTLCTFQLVRIGIWMQFSNIPPISITLDTFHWLKSTTRLNWTPLKAVSPVGSESPAFPRWHVLSHNP